MPSPLSSQTNSTGSFRFWCTTQEAALSAPSAVLWFRLASPKLAIAMASAAPTEPSPRRGLRSMANPSPTARGRCDAIVLVEGTRPSGLPPNTLCRPPLTGSSFDATRPSRMSRTVSTSGALRERSTTSAALR